MSTRSMTIVTEGAMSVYLYRHCDGYLGEAGATLFECIGKAGEYPSGGSLVAALLASGCRYEVVFHRPEDQGDLEHVYVAILRGHDRTPGFFLGHYARPSYDFKGSWRQWPATCGDSEALRAIVNADRVQMNARMAMLRRSQPGAFAGCEDYAMLDPLPLTLASGAVR